MSSATFRIWRGERGKGDFQSYKTEVSEGMVVLDAVHQIQAEQANDLAVRWNCKAAKCGSCGAEVNGKPRLMCKTRLDELPADAPIRVEPSIRAALSSSPGAASKKPFSIQTNSGSRKLV